MIENVVPATVTDRYRTMFLNALQDKDVLKVQMTVEEDAAKVRILYSTGEEVCYLWRDPDSDIPRGRL